MRAGDVAGCSAVEGTTVVWAGWTVCRPASWEAQEGSSTRLTLRMRAVLRITRIIPLSVSGSTPFALPLVFAIEGLDHPIREIDRGFAVQDQRTWSGISLLHDQRDVFLLGDLPHHLFDLFGEVAEQLTFLGLDLPFELSDVALIGEQL